MLEGLFKVCIKCQGCLLALTFLWNVSFADIFFEDVRVLKEDVRMTNFQFVRCLSGCQQEVL